MPKSKEVFHFKAAYIEAIHDVGIAFLWPGKEPVSPNDCLDRNLLHSAVDQPFQGGFGIEYFYPTIYDKAACLFFSIAASQIFGNGNKRTALIALDQFLLANSIYLTMSNEDIYELAKATATYNTRNEDPKIVKECIAQRLRENSIELRLMRKSKPELWRKLHSLKRKIRYINEQLREASG